MFDLENIHSFLKGVNSFYQHFNRKEENKNIIWQEGSTRVIEYNKSNINALPILFFIPSLINKSYILDLEENSSMVKYFVNLGFPVYLIDFTEPLVSEVNFTIADYLKRLNQAIKLIAAEKKFITIGYCLGGVFSYLLDKPKNFLGQVLIATPVDFAHFQKLFKLNNSLVLQNFKATIEPLDKVPHFLVQMFFSYIDPTRIWQKFCNFSTMQNEQEIERFLSIEQWVNDGISLSKKLCIECLDLITDNSLENILAQNSKNLPILIINGSEDKIVPIESSLPLYKLIEHKEIIVENTGHIGLIISKTSQEKIWPSIFKWIVKNSDNSQH